MVETIFSCLPRVEGLNLLLEAGEKVLYFEKVAEELGGDEGVFNGGEFHLGGFEILPVDEEEFVFDGEFDFAVVADIIGVLLGEYFECPITFIFFFLLLNFLLGGLIDLGVLVFDLFLFF